MWSNCEGYRCRRRGGKGTQETMPVKGVLGYTLLGGSNLGYFCTQVLLEVVLVGTVTQGCDISTITYLSAKKRVVEEKLFQIFYFVLFY